jgi:GT2 family glycosyltransferase
MVHIIIPVHNRILLTQECLKSLDEQSYKNWCAYIVDDGSFDGTKEWVCSLKRKKVKYISGNGSLWWTGSMKKGVENVLEVCDSKDLIMSMNNDLVFFDKNSLNELINMSKFNNRAIYGSISVSNHRLGVVMSSGSKIVSWFLNISIHPFVGKLYDDIKDSNNKEVDMLTGRSVVYPSAVFIDNNFDNINFPQYGGDSEFTIRAKRLGYELFLVPSSAVIVNREATGLNPMDRNLSLKQKISSLFSIKSVNNLKIKAKFALKVPPVYARPTYFFISIIKVILQILVGNFLSKRNNK